MKKKAAEEILEDEQERRLQLKDGMWQVLDKYILTWGEKGGTCMPKLATGSKQQH